MLSTVQALAGSGSEAMTPWLSVRWWLPVVLSTTAGAVDVIGFLALGGLFTAHITGNVVVQATHADADRLMAVLGSMLAVAAMATQNSRLLWIVPIMLKVPHPLNRRCH